MWLSVSPGTAQPPWRSIVGAPGACPARARTSASRPDVGDPPLPGEEGLCHRALPVQGVDPPVEDGQGRRALHRAEYRPLPACGKDARLPGEAALL